MTEKALYFYFDDNKEVRVSINSIPAEEGTQAAVEYLNATMQIETATFYDYISGKMIPATLNELHNFGAAVLEGKGEDSYRLWVSGLEASKKNY